MNTKTDLSECSSKNGVRILSGAGCKTRTKPCGRWLHATAGTIGNCGTVLVAALHHPCLHESGAAGCRTGSVSPDEVCES